jgi:hypothetical protein
VYDGEAGVRLTSWALCAAALEEHVKLSLVQDGDGYDNDGDGCGWWRW